MMDALQKADIATWFDLGLMLDRLRDGRATPSLSFDDDFDAFAQHTSAGVGLVTFHCSVVEIGKYAKAMARVLPEPQLHMITGRFDVGAEPLVGPGVELHVLPEMDGFSRWHLYGDFFHHRMERGSPLYNSLILALWDDVLALAERLGGLIEVCDIRLLYVVDVNSIPGNVALALALVLISEHMRIPVIANNHNFYWEGGSARDHFFTNSHLGEVFSIIQMIYPWVARNWISANISPKQSAQLVRRFGHNPANVATAANIDRDLESCLRQLHRQLRVNDRDLKVASEVLSQFERRVRHHRGELGTVMNTDSREYLPGHGRMGFMLMLKSLIDPSHFRVEEQHQRGMAFEFAQRLVSKNPLSRDQFHEFCNGVDNLFLVREEGDMPIMFDHAFAYRHRNRWNYKYRNLTWHELTGVINLLFAQIAAPLPASFGATRNGHDRLPKVAGGDVGDNSQGQWDSMIEQGCGGSLAIDDRARLWERLQTNLPMALFAGSSALQVQIELFILRSVRARLGLEAHEAVTAGRLLGRKRMAPIYMFQRSEPLGNDLTADMLKAHVDESRDEELRLLFENGVCSVIQTDQISVGIDVRQLGKQALRVLAEVRAGGGFLIGANEHASLTTDIIDIERFHVGQVPDILTASVMGLSPGDGYVQWVPAGIRATLAYPTPIQTARGLSETLKGPLFCGACERLGEREVLEELRRDAQERGSPVVRVLEQLLAPPAERKSAVTAQAINGLYADGFPWSGALASVPPGAGMRYRIVRSDGPPRTVTDFIKHFRTKSRIAWNGGYILNAELVGKLGLPESYIGSPLGLVISDGEVISAPLFNKPALLVGNDGSLSIRRVNARSGMRVSGAGVMVEFNRNCYNLVTPGVGPCFYDLLFPRNELPGDGRTLLRLAGTQVIRDWNFDWLTG